MIKSILITFLLFLASYTYSQEIEIGGELGLNISQLEYNGRTSGKVGNLATFLTTDFLVSDNFSLAGKIGYISKGGGNFNDDTIIIDFNFKYLSLYLSPRLYFLNRSRFHPYFHISPSLSYLLSGKVNGTNIKDETENLDFAAQGGIGIKLDLNENLILDINAGFEQGFSKVVSISLGQLHNRSLPYIGIGIRYSQK